MGIMNQKELRKCIKRLNQSLNQNSNDAGLYYDYAMGTLIHQKIIAPPAIRSRITRETCHMIHHLEEIMNVYRSKSQISQINRLAGKGWVTVTLPLLWVIKEAKRYARLTEGFFDITIASLIRLWQYYGKLNQIPPDDEIKAHLNQVDYEAIMIDEGNQRIRLQKDGQKIDLGGIAKGYTANRVIRYFRSVGLNSAMINLGGHVAVLGKRPDGNPWQIGIQDPDRERGVCLGSVSVQNQSVVTSGNYERQFINGHYRYHHILNPLTGYPAESGLKSVTIIHDDSLLADVLSTTLFGLGLKAGLKLIKRFADVAAILITDDRQLYVTGKPIMKLTGDLDNKSVHQI